MLGKYKLNTIELLISEALTDSYISYDQFVSVNNVLREYNEMKEKIKKSWNILYNKNGNLLCQLQEKYWEQIFKC